MRRKFRKKLAPLLFFMSEHKSFCAKRKKLLGSIIGGANYPKGAYGADWRKPAKSDACKGCPGSLCFGVSVRCGLSMKLKIFKENIASDIKLPVIHKDKEPPRVESVDNIIKIFKALHKFAVPAFALLTFAGIRPEEISSKEREKTIITWDNINIEDKTLTVPSAVAKTRKVRRSEDIPDNLWEWLKIIPPEERKRSSIIFLCFHCYCFTRIVIVLQG